jgi:hypothetical protein
MKPKFVMKITSMSLGMWVSIGLDMESNEYL